MKLQLHGDLRKKMKKLKQRAGRGAKLTKVMEPAAVDGGGRERATITNGLRVAGRWREGAVDSAVVKEGAPAVGTGASIQGGGGLGVVSKHFN